MKRALSTIDAFFSNLNGGHRFIAFIFTIGLAATLIAFLAAGRLTGILVGLLILGILWITRSLWKRPETSSPLQVRLTSLAIISSVALAILGKEPESKPFIHSLVNKIGIHPRPPSPSPSPDSLIIGLVLAFVLAGIFVVNWLTRDRSGMQKHPNDLSKDFPEQDYLHKLKRFSEILMTRLNTLDDETKWDDYFFTPLEAEVEVTSGNRSRRTVIDLMRALREERRSKIVLLLGDPGSGKSIALRKLAKELLVEISTTGRIPVYVNLKEWAQEHPWTEATPPTTLEFRSFVLRSLKSYNLFADDFLTTYFDRMFDRGRFFFLLDSFDEIPGVLDVSEASWLIQHLSKLISEFFLSQDGGRGIVSSRFYRRPKFGRSESATFEVRPFTDIRIHQALLRSAKLQVDTIDELFTNRTELIPVARNPFSAALIRLYAESHGGALPPNQLEMYESYIRQRLQSSTEQLQKNHLTVEDVIIGAKSIAWCMFEVPEIGLEAPIRHLSDLLPNLPVLPITSVLRYAGLARVSSGDEAKLSFAHRRINEYFVARRILDTPSNIALDSIPKDSRYRDALALYCEVGAIADVKIIAGFCWSQIVTVTSPTLGSDEHLRSVHCLRFLRDAFRSRPDCLDFAPDLANHIQKTIDANNDLLAAKISLEATGLLPENLAEPILLKALKLENSWISETTLHACRHRKQISEKLALSLQSYLKALLIEQFLRRYREIIFSLSLSDAFRSLRRYCRFRAWDNVLFVSAFFGSIVIAPKIASVVAVLFIFERLLNQSLGTRGNGGLPLTRLLTLSLLIISPLTAGALSNSLRLNSLSLFYTQSLGGFLTPLLKPSFVANHHIILISLLLIIFVFLAPSFDTALYLKRSSWRDITRSIVEHIVAWMLILPIVALLIFTLAKYEVVLWCVAILFGAALIVVMCKLFFAGFAKLWRDRTRFRQATLSASTTRMLIARNFQEFETGWYRLQYVKWLRNAQVQPLDLWPAGRPNAKNDDASTLLAQLDERWLNLDT